MNKKSKTAINAITKIRAQNNKLWMALLALAMSSDERMARAILKRIQMNDKRVTKWTGRI